VYYAVIGGPLNLHSGDCYFYKKNIRVRVMVLNVTFNSISAILWRSVLLVEETGVPKENQRPTTSRWQTLSHNVISSTPRHERASNSQR
jgi:hypothetical protein